MSYDSLMPEKPTLRDILARDRTELANERTLLAYQRTGLMLVVTGATAYKLMAEDGAWVVVVAAVLSIAGFVVSVIGFFRFNKSRKQLAAIYRKERS